MTDAEVVDLCAGPGGWDEAARALGIAPLGIETDDAACATREVAGHRTLQGDICALDPVAFAPVLGLIASPPCQAFSKSGKQAGTKALPHFERAIRALVDGEAVDREELDAACADERAHVVLEPIRWVMALRPEWVACEQVDTVLPLWEAMAEGLRRAGYSAWAGILRAEQYGVPQTRRRAILLASRVRSVGMPAPTHRSYRKAPAAVQEGALFELEGDGRAGVLGEEGLLPWVSMADALGWGRGDKAGFPRRNDIEGEDGEYRERDLRFASEPALTLTEKSRSWTRFRSSARGNATVRDAEEPAPTLMAGHDAGDRVWTTERPAPTVVTTRKSRDGLIVGRQLPRGEASNVGGHGWGDGQVTAKGSGTAVRVTETEAAILQGFREDYPWQGSRTKRFQQIGNAIPPPLALACLREVMGTPTD